MRQESPGNLLDHQVLPAIRFAAKSRAQHQQRSIGADFIAQLLKLIATQVLSRDLDEIPLGRAIADLEIIVECSTTGELENQIQYLPL